jgi:hypothetical protein
MAVNAPSYPAHALEANPGKFIRMPSTDVGLG